MIIETPAVKIPIALKIFVTVMFGLLIQLGILYFYSHPRMVKIEMQTKIDAIMSSFMHTQDALEYMLAQNRLDDASKHLSLLPTILEIELVLVIDPQQNILASTNSSYRQSMLSDIEPRWLTESFYEKVLGQAQSNQIISTHFSQKRGQLTIAAPIYLPNLSSVNKGRPILLFFADFSQDKRQAINNSFVALGPIFIGLFMTAIFFATLFQHSIKYRINKIIKAYHKVAEGNYQQKIPLEGNDEISEIAKQTNVLIEQLDKHQQSMQSMVAGMRLKEAENDEMLQSMVDPVITIDQYGCILTFNPAAQKLFQYQPNQVQGKNISILMPQPDAHKHDNYLMKFMLTGEKKIIGIGREVKAKKADDTTFPIYLSVSELPLQPSGVRRFIGSCIDLTELKRNEYKLHRSIKMEALGKLTGGIAHDFNNLLAIIMGYCELTSLNDDLPPSIKKNIREIQKAGKRAADLTTKLLQFARSKPMTSTIVNINNLLHENHSLLEKSLSAHVHLKFDLAPALPAVKINTSEFEHTILNLVINAVHALEDDGKITVSTYTSTLPDEGNTRNQNEYVVCRVCDNGPGIPEQVIDKIFEPFFTTKGEKGTGLGLSQAYGFAKRAGGQINVESSNQGTVFKIYLPVSQTRILEQEQEKNNLKAAGNNRFHVLVVDDEAAMVDVTQSILQHAQYQVTSTCDPNQALQLLTEKPFDLLISDVLMPTMDGFELTQKALALRPELKIQLMSGYLDKKQFLDQDKELQRKVLRKPFTPDDLLSRIAELLH